MEEKKKSVVCILEILGAGIQDEEIGQSEIFFDLSEQREASLSLLVKVTTLFYVCNLFSSGISDYFRGLKTGNDNNWAKLFVTLGTPI